VLALLFTVVIMILFVGGTLWIMYNLDYRMR
jgi:heme/copper-type cytochrome/quinol oxidase subunit 4